MSEQKPHVSSFFLHDVLSRRLSLFAMVLTSLAGMRAVSVSAKQGKRTNQKSKRKKKPNGQDLCLAQVEECLDMTYVLCRDRDDPAECEGPALPCCEHFATCDAAAALTCLFGAAL